MQEPTETSRENAASRCHAHNVSVLAAAAHTNPTPAHINAAAT